MSVSDLEKPVAERGAATGCFEALARLPTAILFRERLDSPGYTDRNRRRVTALVHRVFLMPEPPPNEATDRTLLRRVREGESDAATALYDRYARRLLALAATRTGRDLAPRLDPEDVLQSVFRTFFRRVARGEYDLPDSANLWGLLAVIAVNKVRAKGAYHRAATRDVQATAGDEGLRDVTDDDEMALADLQMTIDEILGGLPESQRAIVRLRIAGEQVADIAHKTGRSKRSVERAIQDFCRTLREMIEPEAA